MHAACMHASVYPCSQPCTHAAMHPCIHTGAFRLLLGGLYKLVTVYFGREWKLRTVTSDHCWALLNALNSGNVLADSRQAVEDINTGDEAADAAADATADATGDGAANIATDRAADTAPNQLADSASEVCSKAPAKMTVTELKAALRAHGASFEPKDKKAKLVELLEAAVANAAADGVDGTSTDDGASDGVNAASEGRVKYTDIERARDEDGAPNATLNDELHGVLQEFSSSAIFATILVMCYPHFFRNLLKQLKSAVFTDKDRDEIKLMARDLHRCRSQAMFDALAQLILSWLRRCKFDKLAKWFEQFYFTAPWSTWWYMASGIAGVMANNNALESSWVGT